MDVERTGPPPKPRKIMVMCPVATDTTFGCHNNDLDTVVRGLLERVFYSLQDGELRVPIGPMRPGIVKERLDPYLNQLVNIVRRTTVKPWSRDQYAESHPDGRKRIIYRRAVESLKFRELGRKDALLKTFVKCEKLNLTIKQDPAPRVIQPRDPRYNVEVGRYIKPLEHRIYRAINKVFGQTVVAKGKNATEVARMLYNKWGKFRCPVAVTFDISRYDQHHSRQHIEAEQRVYNGVYKDGYLKKILRWQIYCEGLVRTKDGRVRYSVEGTKSSGCVTTSTGAIIVVCGMVHDFMESIHVDKYGFVDMGDDNVVIVEEEHLELLYRAEGYYREMGFKLKIENVAKIFERIVFCQCSPVMGSDGVYKMTRDPRVAISKDLTTTRNLPNKLEYDRHRQAVGDAGLALAADLPIWGAFYQFLKRGHQSDGQGTLRPSDSGLVWLSSRMEMRQCAPTAASRLSLFLAFDITPERQIAIENFFDGKAPEWGIPWFIPHWPSDPALFFQD